jgi:hypothetical protein
MRVEEGTMPSQMSTRRDDDERQKNILRLPRRPGATDRISSKQATHLYHARISRHGSLQLPGHGI